MGLFKPNIGNLASAGDTKGLRKALRNKDPEIRGGAAEALGALGDQGAADVLIRVMNGDRDAKVRGRAAKALGSLGDARAVQPICEALSSERVDASWAAPALAALGDRAAVEPLCEALNRLAEVRQEHLAERRSREAGVLSLPGVEDNIQEILKIGDRVTAVSVAGALGELGDERAVEPVGELLDHESGEVQRAAKTALRQIGGKRADELIAEREPSLAERLPPTSESKYDHVGRVWARSEEEAAYREKGEEAGFSEKDIERGVAIRYWYPYHNVESSFIQHTWDLFDSDLKLIDQKTELEEIG